ncbi:MAG: class I mannose-6-phosphate isomerase [Planctomycetaceae bacterium]|nr:class I mannose-6-phosphate isomerase [Planctomycetaceae bacterium]
MARLYPLRFKPVLRRHLWGGRRLETSLGKPLPPGNDWAESWEVVDHGPDQSVVVAGPLAGTTLGQLVGQWGRELLGRHHPQPRFPLLLKFLDAVRTLSVQVHPNDAQAARLTPPDLGKTEAWVVLAAEPGSKIYAGLKPGVDRDALASAIRQGRCQECLHVIDASAGDCVFLPAGAVHAIGEGLLIAEIQQSSDVTYRLYDWNRLGPDGKPRALHVEQALDAIDFGRGPIVAQRPRPTNRPQVERLVECEKFMLDRWQFDSPLSAGGDDRCHIITVLQGAVQIEGDPAGSGLPRGQTALLPAELGAVQLRPQGNTVLLDGYLP